MARHTQRTASGSGFLDAAMAAFAALAVGFVFWAMPNDLFERLVGASGIAALVPAAQPPLGETARAGVIGASIAGVFMVLFLGLSLIGRRVRRRPAMQAPSVPKVRRADAHPDAPTRAPVLAMLELGTPLPPPTRSPWPEARPDGAELLLDEPADEPVAEPEPEPEPEPAPAPVRAPIPEGATIADLMQRLERGLAGLSPESDQPSQRPSSPPQALNDQLRSAIEDLQRLAQRG